MCFCVFTRFVKLKYFNHNQLKFLLLSTLTCLPLGDTVVDGHFRNLDKGELRLGAFSLGLVRYIYVVHGHYQIQVIASLPGIRMALRKTTTT